MSFCLANLDYNEKYNVRNLAMTSLSPGPHELSAEQKQKFIYDHVTDLLRLYDEGVVIKTPLFPNGRRVRVVLIAVCCDHPELCRMCGFADHNTKEGFCPRCKIRHPDLFTPQGMTFGAFPARTNEEHRRNAKAYHDATSPSERDRIFRETQTRWFELYRLPYFDPIRMSIIDPMHNILLGIVKTHWLNAWIETKTLRGRTSTKRVPRELDQIHEYLRNFELPSWAPDAGMLMYEYLLLAQTDHT